MYVEVLDRGPGIPAHAAERMLQPFTRLEAARSGSGTGLGLAIAKGIVEAHGGRIWFQSNSLGTTFHFTLPTAEPANE